MFSLAFEGFNDRGDSLKVVSQRKAIKLLLPIWKYFILEHFMKGSQRNGSMAYSRFMMDSLKDHSTPEWGLEKAAELRDGSCAEEMKSAKLLFGSRYAHIHRLAPARDDGPVILGYRRWICWTVWLH
jgi:hypothetical protein